MTAGTGALEKAYARALAHEKAGRLEKAATGWREVLRLDPEDHGGAAVRLAAIGRGEAPDRAPPAYVATLFDQHAARFDEILVQRLGYRVPEAMAAMLREVVPGPVGRLLDLGCGTGLVGLAFAEIASHATGVDLSEEMLAAAEARGVYDELYVGDIVGFLQADDPDEPPWDLIAAADVLPYLGDLAPLFAAAAAQLSPGGRVVFSTETPPPGAVDRPWIVGPHQRFHHAEGYVRAALDAAGFAVERLAPATIRFHDGAPEPGHVVLARRKSY